MEGCESFPALQSETYSGELSVITTKIIEVDASCFSVITDINERH